MLNPPATWSILKLHWPVRSVRYTWDLIPPPPNSRIAGPVARQPSLSLPLHVHLLQAIALGLHRRTFLRRFWCQVAGASLSCSVSWVDHGRQPQASGALDLFLSFPRPGIGGNWPRLEEYLYYSPPGSDQGVTTLG